MKLHEDEKLFEQAVRATADHIGLAEIYIEKDYWVTYALHTIFHDPIGKQTVFKGGTALSKCYGIIERFSEDIDLVILRAETESANQLNKKIKTISRVVEKVMPEVPVTDVTRKTGMNRKTAHEYEKLFKGAYGQIRDKILVEATWLGNFEPYTTSLVHTYIHDMMLAKGQDELINQHGLQPFEVQVLDIRRTLCEKIMSLVRFSYSENALEDLKKKIRHTYDIHQLLTKGELQGFFHSGEFAELLSKVGQDDVASYKNDNEWLAHHPKDALIFVEPESTWKALVSTYQGVFKNLVFGEFPQQEAILNTLKVVSDRLKGLEWSISF